MYRGRPWTMRQYAGFGSAAETNGRFRDLLDHGQTGLSVAFDLPTQMGYDSDHPMAAGEVGRVGVAIDTLADMRRLFEGIPLDQVSTSMTINAPAAVLLLLYQLVGEEQGVDPAALTGTVQNDVLKEYVARGTYIYPPAPSLRLATDLFAYCAEHLPRFNTISISGYHMAEAGATPSRKSPSPWPTRSPTCGRRSTPAWPSTTSRLGCPSSSGADHPFEEAAKFRAARRIWADMMANRFGAEKPRCGCPVPHPDGRRPAHRPATDQQRGPDRRQALAAVLGGTQSLHTNSFDEALGLPTEAAARLALRTQQVLAYETGMTDTVDPLAGSYFVEASPTRSRRGPAADRRVDALGGAVAAIERGFRCRRSSGPPTTSSARSRRATRWWSASTASPAASRSRSPCWSSTRHRRRPAKSLADIRASRDRTRSARPGGPPRRRPGPRQPSPPHARGSAPVATVGEVCDALRGVFGTYRPPETF